MGRCTRTVAPMTRHSWVDMRTESSKAASGTICLKNPRGPSAQAILDLDGF
jgi:hypothetical protein